jgi:hypothetical protein
MAKNSTRFQPGQSGNPGGRPKLPKELRDAIDAHSLPAIQTLAEIMKDTGATKAARVRAAEALLRKVVPDLSSVDMTAEIETTRHVISDRLPTEEEWEAERCTLDART